LSVLLGSLLVVAGCSLAPTYAKHDVSAPAAFKETPQETALAPSEQGTWKNAQPSKQALRSEWWTVFNDPTLNDQEHQALEVNQDLKAAAARVKESRAINQTAGVGLFPTLDVGFGRTRGKLSPASPCSAIPRTWQSASTDWVK
jgi:multidrug efflux system outer membrane protein